MKERSAVITENAEEKDKRYFNNLRKEIRYSVDNNSLTSG